MWTLLVSLGLLASALPALAAEVVEVRVGRHPTFTRVVFELDRHAGYRIERSDPSSEVAELVVSLEAASSPRTIKKKKLLIEQVVVEPSGSRSVARVRLSKEGLRLKEMILSNPPRIVLDVLSDQPPTPVAKKTPAKPKPAPAAEPMDEEQAFEDVVAQIPVERVPEPEPTPEPVAPAPAPVEVAKVEPEPEPEPAPAPIEEPEPAAESFFEDDPQAEAVADVPEMPDAIGDEPSFGEPPVEEAVAEATPPAPPTPAEPPTPRPMVAKTTPSDDEGGGWMTWALVGVGMVALLLGGVIVAARRRGSDGEWDADSDDLGGDADEANPFASQDDEQSVLGGADQTTVPPMMMDDDEDTTVVSIPDEEKESESVVFDSEETVMDDMEVISRDQVNESLGGSAMPPAVGGGGEEMQQMFAEMSRRMEALEARCDELVDARDRLERQVAAQTEELRVQRAAIARTQRAVRNLGRGEEGEEAPHEATEPALRDPNQPTSE